MNVYIYIDKWCFATAEIIFGRTSAPISGVCLEADFPRKWMDGLFILISYNFSMLVEPDLAPWHSER